MAETKFDVVGMGNAIVDILSRSKDEDLDRLDLRKGAMHLIDAERAESLYAQIGPAIETSGGSACNTIAGLATLGLNTALIGKVADDQLGRIFTHDIRAVGTHFDVAPLIDSDPTSRSFILITPDGQRTMNTYLGAASHLTPDDVDETLVAASHYTFFEGYLWDREPAKQAFLKASAIAHDNARKVAFSMPDVFCVEIHGDAFRSLIKDRKIDILFGNLQECEALYGLSGMEAAIDKLSQECDHAIITDGPNGAVTIINGEVVARSNAIKLDKIEDTTGAGDQFAAGYMAGLCKGLSPQQSLDLGIICATEVISHIGPRPAEDMRDFATRVGADWPM